MKSLIFLVLLSATAISGNTLPDAYATCKLSQPDFSECASKAITDVVHRLAKSGEKDLGVPKLDPLFANEIHVPGNGGKVDLEQEYMDLNIFGLSKGTVTDFKVDLADGKCTMKMVCNAPQISFIGKYKIVGKLLVFTLNGFGRNNVTIEQLEMTNDMKCEKIVKEGKEYLTIKEYKVDMKPKHLFYDFENLVDGNAELSAQILQVVNENSHEIFAEVKQDYEKVLAEIFRQIANLIFEKVPVEDIFKP